MSLAHIGAAKIVPCIKFPPITTYFVVPFGESILMEPSLLGSYMLFKHLLLLHFCIGLSNMISNVQVCVLLSKFSNLGLLNVSVEFLVELRQDLAL